MSNEATKHGLVIISDKLSCFSGLLLSFSVTHTFM